MDLSIYIMISICFCKPKWQNQRKIFGILNPLLLLFFPPLFFGTFLWATLFAKREVQDPWLSRSQDFVMMAWSPKQKSSRPKWLIIGKLIIMHILFSYNQHHLLPRNPNFLLILIVLGVYWMFPNWWMDMEKVLFLFIYKLYMCLLDKSYIFW